MAAQPESVTRPGVSSLRDTAAGRPAATVLPLRPMDAHGRKLPERTSGDRLGPARGLVLGLGMGAVLWIGLGMLAWEFLAH